VGAKIDELRNFHGGREAAPDAIPGIALQKQEFLSCTMLKSSRWLTVIPLDRLSDAEVFWER
jgi:hypothetical protein